MDAEGEKSLTGILIIIGLLLVFASGVMVGGVVGNSASDESWKRDAVKRGHAEYVTDETGKPEWRWK